MSLVDLRLLEKNIVVLSWIFHGMEGVIAEEKVGDD